MTTVAAAVVQVVGRPSAADPVTATARGWQERLGRLDAGGALVDPASPDITSAPRLLVHSVDGGEALGALAPHLDGRQVTLVHHGSAPGSDRHGLRALRRHTRRALAADPQAREELRALGFDRVEVLDPALAVLEGRSPDPAAVASLARHPGRRLLAVGPLRPGIGLERLLAALSDLLTHHAPDAVLTLCGPSPHWYRQQLHRTITRRGLVACEVVAPLDDGEVVARLETASCLLTLRPTALDPYVQAAIALGLPIVGPRSPDLAAVPRPRHVEVEPGAGRRALAAALLEGLDPARRGERHEARLGPADDVRLLRALGLR